MPIFKVIIESEDKEITFDMVSDQMPTSVEASTHFMGDDKLSAQLPSPPEGRVPRVGVFKVKSIAEL